MTRRVSTTRLSLRMAAAIWLVVSAGALDAMADAATQRASGSAASAGFEQPSKLDYLVLASIADSPHLLLAEYRSTAEQRAAARPAAKSADRP